jgi:3-dehydroquinate synthase
LDVLGDLLRARGLSGPIALVSDDNVGPLYAGRAVGSLQKAGFTTQTILIPAGEQHKTVTTVHNLWRDFISARLERGSTIVALGGGVVGDLAGFAAATFLRGIPWVVVPTSLLAMVDASLGGKTGADLPEGKNLVGAFHPPKLVLADPQTLLSLPEVEFRSGLAEVVKHGIISDPALFELCKQGWETLQANLGELVRRGMAVKVRIIQTDPFEQGLRATLNLGHTIGHAVEATSKYQLRHGEAVAIGIVAAARLAVRISMAETGLDDTIRRTLKDLELPTEIPSGMDREQIIRVVGVDKKRAKGKTRFVLPARIGEVQYGLEVEDWEALVRRNRSDTHDNNLLEA